MTLISKPKCRYNHFKYCPEKPFCVREAYPLGNIKQIDSTGCDFWWIDFIQKAGDDRPLQLGMCIDKWNIIYLRDSVSKIIGNQQATEQLRNGLCYEDQHGKIQPKPDIILANMLKLLQENINLLNNNSAQKLLNEN